MAEFESKSKIMQQQNDSVTDRINGWNEWSRHVLSELQRLNDCYLSLDSKITKLQIFTNTEIAMLKVKSGVWGAIGGMIPVIITLTVIIIHFIDKR